MESPLACIFEAIDKSDAENKENIRNNVWFCIIDFFTYFRCVAGENIYFSKTPKDEWNDGMVKSLDEQRRSMHDMCVFDCARLNEICSSLNIDKVCEFDLEDRAKVAQFCGYVTSSLYFGNIKEDERLTEWMSSFPLVNGD